jgi:hypothetical protein
MPHRAIQIGFPVLVGCWALSIIVQAWGMEASTSTPADVGPGFLPLLLAILMVVMLAIETIRQLLRPGPEPDSSEEPAPGSRQLLYLGAVIATAVLTYVVGVLAAVTALIFCSFKVVERRGWRTSLIGTVVLVTALYLVFSTLLRVRLPLFPA